MLEDPRARKIRAVVDGKFDGVVDHRIRMSENHDSVAHGPVEKFIAIDVPAIGAFASRHDARRNRRELVISLAISMAATGDDLVHPLGDFMTLRVVHSAPLLAD